MRFRSRFQLILRWHDAPVGTDREEAVPARSAAIGRKLKQEEQPGERARSMLAGNSLQVHVSAQPAMRVSDEPDGNSPGIKSLIATPAAPGAQESKAEEMVFHIPPARTTRTVAMTHGTNQISYSLGGSRRSIR